MTPSLVDLAHADRLSVSYLHGRSKDVPPFFAAQSQALERWFVSVSGPQELSTENPDMPSNSRYRGGSPVGRRVHEKLESSHLE